MNKFITFSFTLLLIGCASQQNGTSLTVTNPVAKNAANSTTDQATQVVACPNLTDAYLKSTIRPELVIYANNDLKTFAINQADEALSYYFSQKPSDQPLILYVHGRALAGTSIGELDREPKESKDDVIPIFSSKYNVDTVLMLHWPHRKNANGFPEDDAKFSGDALTCVIQKLKSESFNTVKFPGFRALVTHSMGALVLEEALNKSAEDLQEFDVVTIFAAASRASNASLWLSKIIAKNSYVFINSKDFVLSQVKERVGFIPLGMCNSDCLINAQSVQGVTYLDITDIAGLFKKRHNYFVKGKVAKKMVPKILNGELPPLGIQGGANNIRIIRNRDI